MSYHTYTYELEYSEYVHIICQNTKNVYNVGNFYIRNTMTGLKKEEKDRFPLEKEVISIVESSIKKQNHIRANKVSEKLKKAFLDEEKDPYDAMMKEFDEIHDTSIPSKENPFLTYNLLDMVLKQSKNPDYNSMHKQYVQNALKKIEEAWSSYFEALASYQKNPSSFTGKPKIPKYKKSPEMTAKIQGSYIKKEITKDGILLIFPFLKKSKKEKLRFEYPVNNLPNEKIACIEFQPYYGSYRMNIIFNTEDKKEDKKEHIAKNIMGLDPGVNNFATITDNKGGNPFIIKGGFIKSRNQYFNKRKAELQSEGDKATIEKLSKKRNNFFRDCFYKISHLICRIAEEREIDTIVIGHSKFWKQKSHKGKINNQNFVSIPFSYFFSILEYTASKYNIVVVLQEESYTSKSSFLDDDLLPVFKEDTKGTYEFSGSRVKRGLYKSKEGIKINADINGSANIIRKYKADAFSDKKYLYQSEIFVYNFNAFYKVA